MATSQKYFLLLQFLSPVLTSDIHLVAHTPLQLGMQKGQKWSHTYEGPSILSPKTGYKGMTQHPATAGILYGLSCPPIGREGKSSYWSSCQEAVTG